jgi:hypothetical protein
MAMARIEITLPTFHADQIKAFMLPGRFKIIRCGRRWGKTEYSITVACDAAICGKKLGFFAPDYRRLIEPRGRIFNVLRPLRSGSSKTEGQFNTTTGGTIDFWTLNDEMAGRGREYHGVIIDEAAFAGKEMMSIWKRAIRPTLVRHQGWCLVLSNTNGIDDEQFFYTICNDASHGFVEHHAPSHNDPYLPREELEALERTEMPLVFAQEYLARFISWKSDAFFSMDKLLIDGRPAPMPTICDCVFATIDSAAKTGKFNDGTAVVYFALSRLGPEPRLYVIDYDLVQIEGALLETWLPIVFQNLEAFAQQCGARRGSVGTFIEDKSSGMILLQQARRRGWPAHAIDSKLTSVGKSERAISVSGYVYRNWVKMTTRAASREVHFRGRTRNHLESQLVQFRVGDDEAQTRQDDILDAFVYGIAIALGNQAGF